MKNLNLEEWIVTIIIIAILSITLAFLSLSELKEKKMSENDKVIWGPEYNFTGGIILFTNK